MSKTHDLTETVAAARSAFLSTIQSLTETQAHWKPDADTWNICEITEHLFWAEQGALFGMWKTLFAIRDGSMTKTVDSVHKDLPIESIIEKTWQAKEKVPPVAAPRLGGTLAFWKASLAGLQHILNDFANDLKEEELRLQAHPHPISGAMDFQQRIEFLEFHINRHKQQALDLIAIMP